MEGWVIVETGTPSEEEKKKSKHKGLLRFSFVGVGASVAVMIAAIVCKGVSKLKRVELQTSCEDFSNIIGSSLDGTIYKGTLSSGVEIAAASTAVLSAHDWSTQLEAHFRKKLLFSRSAPNVFLCILILIETLSNVNHKNFMNLPDLCEEEEPFSRMMVFKYAPNGTLFEHLHSGWGKLSVLSDPTGKDIGISYELGQELGRGEFGITYLCTDKSIGNTFSCKSISKKKLRTAVDIEDVRREVEIMKHLLPHPNIITLKDMYEDDVASCHIHGVIHRNLKAENFLFANKKEITALKAIDFGLPVFFKPGEHFTEIVGSPYYMAPKVVAENFSVEEVVGIKKSFQLMDVNNNGKITLGELKVGLGKIGHNVPDVDHQMLMEAADVDENGTLDFEEHVAVAIHLRKIGNDEYLHKAFTFFDKNRSGYIEIEELRDALADEVDTNNEEVIAAIIHDVDTKKDGKINYEEFATMMKAGTDWRKT
ncbi:hypothetical protein GIB67_013607 [Kingdonia uniflora]|uniref:Calcium-dependent protein kinase n=1 Tax=Kingdonia uniflora TaxID=39325 RepID=A0A7J7NPN9_9MAGN|nr:hypothetical protein GIB67_013607 [Kingdonia uniflora]